MKKFGLKKYFWAVAFGIMIYSVCEFAGYAQYKQSDKTTPPPILFSGRSEAQDSSRLQYDVKPTVTPGYDELLNEEGYPIDLKDPSNITMEPVYDYETDTYVIHTKIGEREITTPFILSASEYENMEMRKSMMDYYRKKNSELYEQKDKEKFNLLDMKFALGPLDKVFGPGGVQLKTQGSVQIQMGIKSNKTDNPALPASARRKTYFDFDQKIQATVDASVGSKLKFNMTYNTDATFDFDSKNLKLKYDGEEDEIIKSIEAGNVSMTTGSSLIRGSTALFGLKTTMQFGKFTITALASQQNSETQTVNTKGGAQTTEFSINADDYDKNRHFFLGHFFRDNYDNFASKLPYVSSGVNITRIEVWITNQRGTYDEARNIVGFMDLGENSVLSNTHWVADMSAANPRNNANNLLTEIKTNYPDARQISQVSQALEPLTAYGIEGGRDYEKIESARLLSSSEYKLNETLGYISLNAALNADEVLAVAYEYTYQGQVYQVGEFSSDVSDSSQSLYLKLLKGSTVSPQFANWDLMMKNVYSLGAYQVQKENFKLNVKYLSDSTGTTVQYLPVDPIRNKPLLQVLNVDRLDSNEESNPDGFYDFIEGYTIIASQGKVIFPVVEPFGSYLESKITNPADAERYCYHELYDSTQTIAKQFQDKNKFILEGEYQASSGSTIRLNAMNVPRGSVVVTAGGVTLTENSDYTVDYNMGIVTITNQSIIDSGTNISVSLENQSMFSTQRKTLLGLDMNYEVNKDFNIGATLMHFSEKPLTEKVNLGDELINNTIWGLNFSYNKNFMWLTNLLNAIPTVNATAPSTVSVQAEFAQLIPHKKKTGTNSGSSYLDDFENTKNGISVMQPTNWMISSVPSDFSESKLVNDVRYGYNRALLSWYYIDPLFTRQSSSLTPSHIKSDLNQLSNHYVREVYERELYPNKTQTSYNSANSMSILNMAYYPSERGAYNLSTDLDYDGHLSNPRQRWGGMMRKLDTNDFETANIEYVEFWMLDPFIYSRNQPGDYGGDFYINLGEVSEDVLHDGKKFFESGMPIDGDPTYYTETAWGRVPNTTSVTYAFNNSGGAREKQDVGLNGLNSEEERNFGAYKEFLTAVQGKVSAAVFDSLMNDPAADNYHYFRGSDYDAQKRSILDRYKYINLPEGNSRSNENSNESYDTSYKTTPDVEDINQDYTLNEYEKYYQYHISLRPEDLVVGQNYIVDKRTSSVKLRNGNTEEVNWYQFRVPVSEYEKKVGNINDFTSIRFMRMFLTNFEKPIVLRFATLDLVKADWRTYEQALYSGEMPATSGTLELSAVNIEENNDKTPVNYVLPPGISRVVDPAQSQLVEDNEQALSMVVRNLSPGDARAVYKNTNIDMRRYKHLQMFVHANALAENVTETENSQTSVFIRLGSDYKNNFYEYEIPLQLTAPGKYDTYSADQCRAVWPEDNMLDIDLSVFTDLKQARNKAKSQGQTTLTKLYSAYDNDRPNNKVSVMGNPTLGEVKTIMIGIRNNAREIKSVEVWVNELRLQEYTNDGGWAAQGNLNIQLSDLGSVNLSGHLETAGFGGLEDAVTERNDEDILRLYTILKTEKLLLLSIIRWIPICS